MGPATNIPWAEHKSLLGGSGSAPTAGGREKGRTRSKAQCPVSQEEQLGKEIPEAPIFFKKRQKSRFLQKIRSFKIITRSNKVYLQSGSLHGAGVRDCGVLTHWCLCGVWHVVNIHSNSWVGEWINGWMRGLAGCPVPTGWEVCLPRIPWENPVSSGSMPMEALELAWTRGLAGSQSSKELG